MMRRKATIAAITTLVLLTAGACGKSDKSSNKATATTGGGPVVIGAFAFPESAVLAQVYAGALRKAGFTPTVRANLGPRETVEPALQKGDIDLVPEYLGNALSFYDPNASKPGDDVAATAQKLRDAVSSKQLTVLEPSGAADGDSIGVTRATASQYQLHSITELTPVASKLVLGGPPECATRITCKKGLEDVYGLHFKDFKSLDAGGPLTKTALDRGDIQVARLFSSDSDITTKGYVILDDPKHIQPAGNVVAVVRNAKASAALKAALDKVAKAMTTAQLVEMNKKLDVDKADPADVARAWIDEYLK